jgi:hypothetical protein
MNRARWGFESVKTELESISKLISPLVHALLHPRITAAVAITAGVVLYLNVRHLLPVALEPGVLLVVLVVGILCGCVACVNIASSLWRGSKGLRHAFTRRIERHRDKKRIEGQIPLLSPKERRIIGYLLAKQQKMFEVLPDGEEAATLIAKGFVVHAPRQAMAIHRDIPVEVPDHVWEVLLKHQSEFSFEAPKAGEMEVHPWRTHWMAR